MTQAYVQSRSETQTWSRRIPKMIQKWSKSDPKVIQKWSQRLIDQFPLPGSKKTRLIRWWPLQKERFFMIFEDPKWKTNRTFVETRFFHKKVGFFTDRTHSQAVCMVLKVQGRFWSSPEPTEIEKSEVQTPKKTRL